MRGIRIISSEKSLFASLRSLLRSRVKVMLPVTDKNNECRFPVTVRVSEEAPHGGQNYKATMFRFY